MTSRYNDGNVISRVHRRGRWTLEEEVWIVEETYLPGMSVSLVAGDGPPVSHPGMMRVSGLHPPGLIPADVA